MAEDVLTWDEAQTDQPLTFEEAQPEEPSPKIFEGLVEKKPSYFLPQQGLGPWTTPVTGAPNLVRNPITIPEGIYNTLAKGIGSVLSPLGLITAPAVSLKPIQPIVLGVLGGLGAKQIGEEAGQLSVPMGRTAGQVTETLGDIGQSSLMTLAPFAHVLTRAAPILPQATRAATETIIEKGLEDASRQQKTAEVYGPMRPQSEQGLREVPEQEGGPGVQPQAQAVAEKAPLPLTPEQEAVEQARLAEEFGEEKIPPPTQPSQTLTEESAPLTFQEAQIPDIKKGITPEHIDWGSPRSWEPLTTQEAANPDLLTEKLKSEGVGRVFGAPVSLTRRFLVLRDNQTGSTHVVSAYQHGRSGLLAVDPAQSGGQRPNRSIKSILQRFTPLYTGLLKEPVRDFHQKFDSLQDFFEGFGGEARSRAEAQRAYPEPLTETTPQPIAEPIPEPLPSSAEAKSLADHFSRFADLTQGLRGIEASKTKNQIRSALRKTLDAIADEQPLLTQEEAALILHDQLDEIRRTSKTTQEFQKRFEDFVGQRFAGAVAAKPPQAVVGPPKEPTAEGARQLGAAFFSAPANHPFGPLPPSAGPSQSLFNAFTVPINKLATGLRNFWGSFSMQTLPRITRADRATGEAGGRFLGAAQASVLKAAEFSDRVFEGIKEPLFDKKLGVALSEDNLRSIRVGFQNEAIDALAKNDQQAAAAAIDKANRVTTLIGAERSPFRNEAEYQDFLTRPETQLAIQRHIQLWETEKEPIYRKAADLDPDAPLESRGEQTGARINLKALNPGEASRTSVGGPARSPLVRQAATLLRRDPFARQAKGSGQSYEGSYSEIIKNGFVKEYPVAAQHEFIRQLIDSGNAVMGGTSYDPTLLVKGESTHGFLMNLKPWSKRWLHIPKSLAAEFQNASGLSPSLQIPVFTKTAEFLTRQSVAGLAEGSAHTGNLLMQSFTGVGPTSNPLLNVLMKSIGRSDLIYSLPRILIKGFTNQRKEMLELAEMSATKEKFSRTLGLGTLINHLDQGARIVASDIYKGFAEKGWVENTETGRREFVNQLGQYNKRAQPLLIRALRESQIQPFATAMQTFAAAGTRALAMDPGMRGTTIGAKLALRADMASGLLGLAALVGGINYLLSNRQKRKPSVFGPTGTKLGSVGWIGDDGKVQQFDVLRFTAWGRGLQQYGISDAIQASRLDLAPNQQLAALGRAPARMALNYVTGPAVRFGTIAATGARPSVPMIQEAPVRPPDKKDEFSPLKSQLAANIGTAMQEANPAINAIVSYHQGKPLGEIIGKQATKYVPSAGLTEKKAEALPQIVHASQVKTYADDVAKQARKLPLTQRAAYIQKRLKDDQVQDADIYSIYQAVRRTGIFTHQ